MERRRQYIPTGADQLEGRVVLSQTSLGLSTVVSGLGPHLQVLNRKHTALIAEVNQAFDSFRNDFDQARATYFASIQGTPSSNLAATAAFESYTQQRTLLLSQQIVSSFVQSPQGTAKASGQPPALKILIDSKVIGPKGRGPAGSLVKSLEDSITSMSGLAQANTTAPPANTPSGPAPALASSPTTTLYTLTQDNAIEAARTATLTGISVIKHGAFGIQKQSHY
jgi:hypothetical protein